MDINRNSTDPLETGEVYSIGDGGIFKPEINGDLYSIKHGDRLVPIISAASIIAKVTRDKIMLKIDKEFPMYDFKKHKGYPTRHHIEMIKKYGICKYHRRTFKPIKYL